jgi:hypothetical protein
MSAPIVTLSIPYLPDDVDMLTAALAYADFDWYVLPVKRGTKHPGSIVGEHWQTCSSRDPKVICGWFAATTHEIVLHCGRSGAVVFDVDNPDKVPDILRRHLDSAPFQSTRPDVPGRGHYVFAMPSGRTFGNGLGRLPPELATPPGWYPDATDKPGELYWDGRAWHTAIPVSLKCIYMAVMSLDSTGTARKRWTNRWVKALNAFRRDLRRTRVCRTKVTVTQRFTPLAGQSRL